MTDTRRVAALLHRHGALSFWDFAAAAPYVAIEMYGDREAEPAGVQGRDLPEPAQAHRRAQHARGAGRPARAAHQPGAGRPWRRHGRLRQPDGAPVPRPTRCSARRAAPPRSSSRSGPAWSSSSRRPSGIDVIRAHEEHYLRRAVDGVARRTGHRRSSATSTPSGCRSCRSSSARPAVATCTTTSSSRCSTTCSASSRAAAAPAPAPTATGCSASTSSGRTSSSARSPAAARGSSPAGCG